MGSIVLLYFPSPFNLSDSCSYFRFLDVSCYVDASVLDVPGFKLYALCSPVDFKYMRFSRSDHYKPLEVK